MIEGPILPDQQFVHERTGDTYIVEYSSHNFLMDESEIAPGTEPAERTLVKIGDSDEWDFAIVYHDPKRPNMTFIRDEAKFRANFRRI